VAHQTKVIRMAESESMNSEVRLQELVAQVAAAYFSGSHVSVGEIPTVIAQIAASLGAMSPAAAQASAAPEAAKATSAQVRKSITPDVLISFEDGKAYKTLRRHLSTKGLTPEQYRQKWGLPSDYPMVSPNYSAARSAMAKSLGLGRLGQAERAKGGARGGRRRKAAS
jgi:predicted transcriptional regulator